jgi:hypothetical protein
MGIIQVRDVPDDVQAELVRRAKGAGQSLQQYLRGLLIAQARRADVAAVWAEIGERATRSAATYSLDEAAEDIRAMRDEDRGL